MKPYLDSPTPIRFAHRGGSLERPENTVASFEHAYELGYRYFETDVHVSADGTVYCFHDDTVDRTTNGTGQFLLLQSQDVDALDSGYSFSTDGHTFPYRDKGLRIPRLSDILERWPDVRINIDPKQDSSVEPLLILLRTMDAFDRVCVASFSDRRIRRARVLSDGRVCTAMGPAAMTLAWFTKFAGYINCLGGDCIQVPLRHGGVSVITPRLVAAAHRHQLPIHVWTIDDEAEMNRLLDMGVDGVMTDRPTLLRSVLERRGALDGA